MAKPLALCTVVLGLFLIACGGGGSDHPGADCGDGKTDPGEACDDGNTVDGDGCDNNCTATACGNGVQTMNEGCDDGNTVNDDGCDSNCMMSGCGNGTMTGTEQCDDGNTTSGDGCDNNCTATACGNGVMTSGEACDDGNTTDADGCDSNCKVTGCGNGVKTGTEQCDDGNTTDFDGCSAQCATETLEMEPNDDGTVATGASGIVGNDFSIQTANGPYSQSVTIIAKIDPAGDEDVFAFTNTGTAVVNAKMDIWNLGTGFGIGTSCGDTSTSLDTGLNIRNAAGAPLMTNDDRSTTDYCSALTVPINPGQTVYAHVVFQDDNTLFASRYALQVVYSPSTCGDGMLGGGETCDDSNTANGDGCSAMCQIEGSGAEMEPNEDGTPSLGGSGTSGNDFSVMYADMNTAIAGSKIVVGSLSPEGDEDVYRITNAGSVGVNVAASVWNLAPGYGVDVPCGISIDTAMHVRDAAGVSLTSNDDRNGSTDRCSTVTVGLLPGQTRYVHLTDYGDNSPILSYALKFVYTPSVCGNGTVEIGETCDDSNTTSNDGCSSTCQTEVICGDGVIGAGEQCDDMNTTNGDGCSSTCQLENAVTEVEPNEDGTPSTGGTGTTGNDFASANADANGAFMTNVTIAASVSPAGDEDVFAIKNPSATNPTSVKLDIYNLATGFGVGVACGTSIDTAMHVRDAAGTSLALNDDRNGSSDRCSSITYTLAAGQTVYAHVIDYGDDAVIASYAVKAVFTPVVCGDNIIAPGEQCDDGNTANGDGCSSTCQIEATCGDGIVGNGEQCDDGNTTNGDGCSSTCQVETTTEIEPNNAAADADLSSVQISGDLLISGAIAVTGDKDMYRLTVATATAIRFETFTTPFNCAAGTAIDVRLFDSTATQILADTSGLGIASCGSIVTYLAAGTYYVQVEEHNNDATIAAYLLEVNYQTDAGLETEPNDTQAVANTNLSAPNMFVFGDHALATDADVYAISVPAGGRIRAELIEGDTAETCESNGIDSRLTLYNESFTQLVDDDDDGRGFCSLIDGSGTTPLDANAKNATTATKTYYLQVRASASASGAAAQFVYRLVVTIR